MNQPSPSEPAMHLLHGWWVASCPNCGYELVQRRDQERAERAGRQRRCPICRPNSRDAPRSDPAQRGAGIS